MLNTSPADLGGVDQEAMAKCIEECIACAQAYTACADALPVRGHGGRADQVHPHRHVLRRHLHRHRSGSLPPHRLRRQHHPRSCRHAPPSAMPARTNARATPTPTSTAGSAPKPAGAASRHATTCSLSSADTPWALSVAVAVGVAGGLSLSSGDAVGGVSAEAGRVSALSPPLPSAPPCRRGCPRQRDRLQPLLRHCHDCVRGLRRAVYPCRGPVCVALRRL